MKIKKKIEADIAFGVFKMEPDNSLKITYSFKDLKNRYLKHSKQNNTYKTVDRVKSVFNVFYKYLRSNKLLSNGDIRLNDITQNIIELYKMYRSKNNISSETIRLDLRHLKAAFNCAVDWDLMKKNPVIGIKMPKGKTNRVRFLTLEEINLLLDTIKKSNENEFHDLIVAYINTGARRFELLPPIFTWENINFIEKRLFIVGKRSNERYIPINVKLMEILKRNKDNGFEFPFNFKPDYVSHKIRYFYNLAKIEGANLHSLRKTFGSLLLQQKFASMYEVSKLLGHSSIKTTERYYVDLLDDNYREPLDKLSKII